MWAHFQAASNSFHRIQPIVIVLKAAFTILLQCAPSDAGESGEAARAIAFVHRLGCEVEDLINTQI
jgi:hypothetical protein